MEQIMNQTDVKVSFYLKKSEADARGNCPVMARLIVGKHSETAFSVKFRVPQSLWSSGRACGKSVAARDINNRLDEIRAAALGIYAEQSAIREDVTAEDVKHQLLGMASEQETLLSYFRLFIRNFEKRVGINRTEKTLRAYRNSYNHLVRFLQMQYKLSDIPFAALDRSFIEKYDLYLRTECCLASGTIVNLTVQLKTIVGEAIADGIITVFPFVGYEPVHPKPEQKKESPGIDERCAIYKEKYLTCKPLAKRAQVCIEQENACIIKYMLMVIDPKATMSGYINNIVDEHLKKYSPEIMKLYKDKES